jgi:hypothetical protein
VGKALTIWLPYESPRSSHAMHRKAENHPDIYRFGVENPHEG